MYSRPSTAVPPLPILSQPRVLHPNALTPMTMRPEIGRLKGHLAASRPTTAGAASHTPRGLMTGDVALALEDYILVDDLGQAGVLEQEPAEVHPGLDVYLPQNLRGD